MPVGTDSRVFVIRLSSGRTITVKEGARVSAEEFLGLASDSPECAFAEVGTNPNDPAILGLKNLTSNSWSATVPGGGQKQVLPGRSIKLAAGTRVNFGEVVGTIQDGPAGLSLNVSSDPPVPLRKGLKITARGLIGMRGSAPGTPAFEVLRNPTDPMVLGVKNLSGLPWSAVLPDGAQRRVEPGKSLTLAPGTSIDFGGIQGIVYAGGGGIHRGEPRASGMSVFGRVAPFLTGRAALLGSGAAIILLISIRLAMHSNALPTNKGVSPFGARSAGTEATGGSAGERGDFPTDSEIAASVSQIEADPATQKLADEMADNLKRQMSEPIPAYLANLAPPPDAAR